MYEENQSQQKINPPKGVFEKVKDGVTKSVTLKLLGIGLIILLMNVPLSMINDVIRERERYLTNVQAEIQNKWGRSQRIKGLELTIPYSIVTTIKNEKTGKITEYKNKNYAHFLPDQLNIDGTIQNQKRHRGIYDVTVYNSKLAISGNFSDLDFSDWKEDNWEIHWDQAFVSLGLSQMSSIEELVKLKWNTTENTMQPGVQNAGIVKMGIGSPVLLSEETKEYSFSFNLQLKGSESLSFTPLGKETNVHLNSPWKSPKYIGDFSPQADVSIISEDGFDATWKVLYLNRSYPQKYLSKDINVEGSAFGVSLFEPVDEYAKTVRSSKYAMLFIALTFITFFFIQIINKVSIHPFQFVIVGLALCLFYILLISLSEHIGFNKAYIVAAIGIIIEISLYVKAIFKSYKLGAIMLSLLLILYVFIFVIIQLENLSLLAGSLGLFIILGVLMYISRNIDWKNLGNKPSSQSEI